jgi:hypothetical protein
MRNENFFIVIYHSSLVKGAMNAACVCKLPQFLLFSQAKGGTKTIAHFSIAEGSSFEAWIDSFMIVNCGMKEKHLIQMHNEYSPHLSKLMA